MDTLFIWLIQKYLHHNYIRYKQPIFYIKGTGKNYPKYILYTEDKHVYERMDKF